MQFKEDKLKLLSPTIHFQRPLDFYRRIIALYKPKSATGKSFNPKPKGKFLTKPTKGPKRPEGQLEVKNLTALGEKTFLLSFDRSMQVSAEQVKQIAKTLLSSELLIEEFLKKKNFSLASKAELSKKASS